MAGPLFILIESNTTGTGRLFARAARALGCDPVVLAADPARYPYLVEEGFRAEAADTGDVEAVLSCIARWSRTAPVAGVCTSSEYFTVMAAEVARRLGLPGVDPRALALARDKGAQYEALRTAGVPVPPFARVGGAAEVAPALRRIGVPCVVKPVRGSGSVDVRRFDDPRPAEDHLHRLLQARANERGIPVEPGAVLMRYVPGPEYSVEVFSGSVVGITRKHLSAEPAFVELGHDFPASLPPEAERAVTGCAIRAVDALGLDRGPAHVELRLGAGGPALMEVNGRLAGGFIPSLVREALAVDLVEATVRLACGGDAPLTPRRRRAASIRFVSVADRGRFGGFSGLDGVAARAGIIEVQTYQEPGALVEPHGDFRDRLGHVLAVGDDVEESARRADAARAQLQAVVWPAAPATVA
jgi:S-sulfo-L-cysteine synthase (3-phospho-L-serine-dependent)